MATKGASGVPSCHAPRGQIAVGNKCSNQHENSGGDRRSATSALELKSESPKSKALSAPMKSGGERAFEPKLESLESKTSSVNDDEEIEACADVAVYGVEWVWSQ